MPYRSTIELLEEILDVLVRVEHMQALRLVIDYGTPEHQQAARQHMLDELAKQAAERP